MKVSSCSIFSIYLLIVSKCHHNIRQWIWSLALKMWTALQLLQFQLSADTTAALRDLWPSKIIGLIKLQQFQCHALKYSSDHVLNAVKLNSVFPCPLVSVKEHRTGSSYVLNYVFALLALRPKIISSSLLHTRWQR